MFKMRRHICQEGNEKMLSHNDIVELDLSLSLSSILSLSPSGISFQSTEYVQNAQNHIIYTCEFV